MFSSFSIWLPSSFPWPWAWSRVMMLWCSGRTGGIWLFLFLLSFWRGFFWDYSISFCITTLHQDRIFKKQKLRTENQRKKINLTHASSEDTPFFFLSRQYCVQPTLRQQLYRLAVNCVTACRLIFQDFNKENWYKVYILLSHYIKQYFTFPHGLLRVSVTLNSEAEVSLNGVCRSNTF